MSSNNRFTAATRSTAFSLALSHPQIATLLSLSKATELMERYPWYDPYPAANFGTGDELAVQWSTSQVRALVRRGLIDVCPVEPPCSRLDVLRITRAGRLMVLLLREADFACDPKSLPSIPLHPDDRTPVLVQGNAINFGERKPDRRAGCPDEDKPFMSFPFAAEASR